MIVARRAPPRRMFRFSAQILRAQSDHDFSDVLKVFFNDSAFISGLGYAHSRGNWTGGERV